MLFGWLMFSGSHVIECRLRTMQVILNQLWMIFISCSLVDLQSFLVGRNGGLKPGGVRLALTQNSERIAYAGGSTCSIEDCTVPECQS